MEKLSEKKPEQKQDATPFRELVKIIHQLRAPGGCPWDRKQTPQSLKSFVIEEAYEVIDAIDGGNPEELCEELGDLLLQVVLQTEIASETGTFSIDDVISGINSKLIHRHPHVFGETTVKDAGEVLNNWERLKKEEKKNRGLLAGLPKQLPALQKAARMGEKATRVGFDWPDSESVREKVSEELGELDEAISNGDPKWIRHELGDLLFSIAQWARHLDEQPEEALTDSCKRFTKRFVRMEQTVHDAGRSLNDLDIDKMEELWQQVKEL
jgi:tetrapyrrole methylase family protein/MazG family protein